MIERRQVTAVGEGRARRYFGARTRTDTSVQDTDTDTFPGFIPLSADSQDILAYVDQPVEARKPVGYQRDFLDAYRPNETWYLSESLRRQLYKMGRTADVGAPAGTYSRAILNRLLIDLSWAPSPWKATPIHVSIHESSSGTAKQHGARPRSKRR